VQPYWLVVILAAVVSALDWLKVWLKQPFKPTELSVQATGGAGFLCMLGGLIMGTSSKGRVIGPCGVVVGVSYFGLWLWKRRLIRNADLPESDPGSRNH
jgi:hypothetical protein